MWWRELEILWWPTRGCAGGSTPPRRSLKLGPPKSRRRRITMYPARTPGGVDLAALVERRLAEVGPEGVMFPSPRRLWARRSNYRRNVFGPAAAAAGWPRRGDGRWQWSFRSLRHMFATWALDQPGASIADVSRLLGQSTVRVTQDLYIAPDSDLYDRFFTATA